jgi:hypothetical protein
MLFEHLGGRATVVQRAMITRAARMALHLELLDERVFIDGYSLNEHDYAYYCSWSNSLTRTLSRIGIDPAAAKPVSLHQYFGRKSGEAAD